MNQIKTIQQRLPIFSIPTMSNANALTDVRFNSEFSVNPWGYSNYVHEIFIDQQRFDATIEADQSTGVMNALISGDQFKLSDYLPESGSSTNPANSGAIFAPLALPFIFWQGQSQIELTINEIVLDTFSLSNLYGNLSGLDNFLQLTSFNADLLGGQLNATARVDLRDRSPSFSLQTSIDSVDLNKAFSAVADLTDVSGTLSGNITMSGTGQDITEIQQSLSGSGRFTVLEPSYEAMNLEQTVCQAASTYGWLFQQFKCVAHRNQTGNTYQQPKYL
jgi:AsmA protein